MMTLAVAMLLLGYILLYSGFRHKNADGTPYTPLDAIRESLGKKGAH